MTDIVDRGGWMMTNTGRRFYPFDPRPEDIDIRDITWALANTCRYGGHTRRFYSVAEHSVHVSRLVAPALAFAALLHDAAEAYLGDIPRPIKYAPAMAEWRTAERRLEAVISQAFDVPAIMAPAIKAIDDRIILDEWAELMVPTSDDIGVSGDPLGITIECWSPADAAYEFLRRYLDLSAGRR